MPLYRLTPVNPNDPNWRTSIHRDVAVIRAGSEEQARSLASKAFDTTLAPSSPGGKIATPLWHQVGIPFIPPAATDIVDG